MSDVEPNGKNMGDKDQKNPAEEKRPSPFLFNENEKKNEKQRPVMDEPFTDDENPKRADFYRHGRTDTRLCDDGLCHGGGGNEPRQSGHGQFWFRAGLR